MNKQQLEQALIDHADLLGRYDDLAKQVFDHLDMLHVDLCQLEDLRQEIYQLRPDIAHAVFSAVAVEIPETEHPQLYTKILAAHNVIVAKNGLHRLEAAGLTVYDWERERAGQLIVRDREG